ncbi:MAG: ribose 5-phosphate isomerase B [Bacteriovoracia bacterium]
MSQRVLIASDHAGFPLKTALQEILKDIEWDDLGPSNTSRVDYPDYAAVLARKISEGAADLGILICGTGIGMSIAANKFKGVRAAVVENPTSARLARDHNHANILCLGARMLGNEYAAEITRKFLDTSPSADPRHRGRVQKIGNLENQ